MNGGRINLRTGRPEITKKYMEKCLARVVSEGYSFKTSDAYRDVREALSDTVWLYCNRTLAPVVGYAVENTNHLELSVIAFKLLEVLAAPRRTIWQNDLVMALREHMVFGLRRTEV